ncbi:MAG: transposase [Myxococcota bacterium]
MDGLSAAPAGGVATPRPCLPDTPRRLTGCESPPSSHRRSSESHRRGPRGRNRRTRFHRHRRLCRRFLTEQSLWGILNVVILTVTNACLESLNTRIVRVKKAACGFCNRQRFRNANLFHLGGLDLYPAAATHPNSRTESLGGSRSKCTCASRAGASRESLRLISL